MDMTSLSVLLAFASLLLGVVAALIFIYVVMPKRRRAREKAVEPNPAVAKDTTPPPAEEPPPPPSTKRTGKVKQHSLFVIFNQPDASTDARLTEWLREKGAHYDAIKKVFLIDGQQPSEKTSLRRLSPTPGAVSAWAGGTNRFDRRRGRVMAIGQPAQHGVPI